MRASGAGGQHVNKTDSAVRATHIPTKITAYCQDSRSQHDNKAMALQVLATRVYTMHKEKEQNALTAVKKSQKGTGDRSEKIRTYHFPQNRVSDHRTGLTITGIELMLSGTVLSKFIEASGQQSISLFIASLENNEVTHRAT